MQVAHIHRPNICYFFTKKNRNWNSYVRHGKLKHNCDGVQNSNKLQNGVQMNNTASVQVSTLPIPSSWFQIIKKKNYNQT